MADEIKQLRKLYDKTTPGAWKQAHHVDEPRAIVAADSPTVSLLGLDRDGMAIVMEEGDAAFIVAARNALPALLDRIERLEAVAVAARAFDANHVISNWREPTMKPSAVLLHEALAILDGKAKK